VGHTPAVEVDPGLLIRGERVSRPAKIRARLRAAPIRLCLVVLQQSAVSTSHGDTLLRDQLFDDLDRLPPVQRLTRSAIQFCRYSIKFFLGVQRQIGALREILPEQPVRRSYDAAMSRQDLLSASRLETGGAWCPQALGRCLCVLFAVSRCWKAVLGV
jgi:hypothetical protein